MSLMDRSRECIRGDLLAFDRQAACRVRPKSSLIRKLHSLIAGSWIIPLAAPASRSGARPNFRTGLNWCLAAPGNIVASSGPRGDGWDSRSESNAPRTSCFPYTTGTRRAATAAGEMTSISSGTRHRSVSRTLGASLLMSAPSMAKPSKPLLMTSLHFCT